MGKKKKVTGALLLAGVVLGIFGSSAAVYAATNDDDKVSATGTVANIRPQFDEQNPFEGFNEKRHFGDKQGDCWQISHGKSDSKQSLSEEQIAALETYAELSKEIYQRYNEQYSALVSAFEAEVEKIYASVIGGQYTELKAEYDGLHEQYQGLVNGFYSSEEYINLKTELNSLISQLAGLEKGSSGYRAVMDEINIVWGKISVLAGEVNSQILLVRTNIAEITTEINALIKQNKEAINDLLNPVVERFHYAVQSNQSALFLELKLLRQTLGI